ncbi:hypothetical protein M9458_055412, partial [Cirrhinus mrigala]
WRRGMGRSTSPLCLSLFLKTRRARTPVLFSLGPGPPRDEGFESRRACHEPFDHSLDGGTEKHG